MAEEFPFESETTVQYDCVPRFLTKKNAHVVSILDGV